MKIVIIGGGTAGIATATRLRRRDENAEIIILEKTAEFGIALSALPYLLANIIPSADNITAASVEQMKKIFKIDIRLNHEVIDIDRKNKILTIDGKTPISYDKLVLATGAVQLRPDIEGVLGDNIFTLRNLNAIDKIKGYFAENNSKKVLILGGGRIGLTVAEAFHRLGAEISIVEEQAHLLPAFDAELMKRIENHLLNFNIKLYLGRKATGFCDTYAMLDNGRKIDYDLAIIATGVRPDVKLPIMADIPLGASGGILVNEYVQTNDEDIFAAGADVEFINAVTGKAERWPDAPRSIRQGNIIADYLSGNRVAFGSIVPCEIMQIFGYTLGFCGVNAKGLQQEGIKFRHIYLLQNDCDVFMPNSAQMLFKLLFDDDGKILGFQAIGKKGIETRLNLVANLMRFGGSVYDLQKIEIAYAPPLACAKDALQNLGMLAAGVINGKIKYFDVSNLCKDENIFLVDIRKPNYFETRHLPHAINIPLEVIRDNLASFPRDTKIVFYCSHGYGAYLAFCMLRERGFDNVYLLNTPYDLSFDL